MNLLDLLRLNPNSTVNMAYQLVKICRLRIITFGPPTNLPSASQLGTHVHYLNDYIGHGFRNPFPALNVAKIDIL